MASLLVAGSFAGSARAEVAPADDTLAPCEVSPMAGRVCAGLRAANEGRWLEAETTLDAVRLVSDPVVSARSAEIDAALLDARAHLGSLEVRCTPAGATIAVDGTTRGLSPLDRPLRLELGEHEVSCADNDHDTASARVTISAGALVPLELAPVAHDHRPVLERVGDPGEAQRIVGIGALSLGGVSLAIGLGTLVAGLDAAPPEREPFFDVARGTLIAGGVLVVAGIVLVLTAE